MKHACLSLLLILAASAGSVSSVAQTLTQTFELQPGWNSIWLEVEPPDNDPGVVFGGIPAASVWTWSDRISATDFIQNPGDAGWNRAQWLSYFPPESPEAILSNLRAILPQRAYLLKLAGTNSVTWSVSGRPTVLAPDWGADRFNLRGFPVDPEAPPTFRTFFRPSTAHYDSAQDQPGPIFRLSPNGQWTAVAANEPMKRGEAYWVYSRGVSDYVAPFHLKIGSGNMLDFDASVRRIELSLCNRYALEKGIRIEHLSDGVFPLLLLPRPELGDTNAPVPLTTHQRSVPAGVHQRLSIGIDRSKLTSGLRAAVSAPGHSSLLSVTDNEGTQFYVGVRALAGSEDFTGLWMGTVTITNVAPTDAVGGTSASGAVPMPFPLRVLLHVDSGGQVSLLRDVALIYTSTNVPAADTNQPATSTLVPRPARLITDPGFLSSLPPSDLQARRIVGRRLTAPHFDFALPAGQYQLALQGVFALSNQVSGTLNIPADLPTNPFLHRYHPDHGTNRAYSVTREIRMQFGAPINVPPGEGDDAMGGSYSEVIAGLHQQPLATSGSLLLRRISNVGTLNAP